MCQTVTIQCNICRIAEGGRRIHGLPLVDALVVTRRLNLAER